MNSSTLYDPDNDQWLVLGPEYPLSSGTLDRCLEDLLKCGVLVNIGPARAKCLEAGYVQVQECTVMFVARVERSEISQLPVTYYLDDLPDGTSLDNWTEDGQ